MLQSQLRKQTAKLHNLEQIAATAASEAESRIQRYAAEAAVKTEALRVAQLGTGPRSKLLRTGTMRADVVRSNAACQTVPTQVSTVKVSTGIGMGTQAPATQPAKDTTKQTEPEPEPEQAELPTEYTIGFETADLKGAGTTADICVRFVGHRYYTVCRFCVRRRG